MVTAILYRTTRGLEGKIMQTKAGMKFSPETEKRYKTLLINMIYKLLPIREEGKDWERYLDSCLAEIHGFVNIFEEIDELQLVRILSKLESLKEYTEEDDFYSYRKTVLECTNLVD